MRLSRLDLKLFEFSNITPNFTPRQESWSIEFLTRKEEISASTADRM
jgi:hypothetical protein